MGVTKADTIVYFFIKNIVYRFYQEFSHDETSSMTFSCCLYFRAERDSEYLVLAMFGQPAPAVLSLYLGNILHFNAN